MDLALAHFKRMVRDGIDEKTAGLAWVATQKRGTGMNAHFAFRGVPAGDYHLLTQWVLSDKSYLWFTPVTIKGGVNLTRDLDNAVEASSMTERQIGLLCPNA